jgi:hypothetical protein
VAPKLPGITDAVLRVNANALDALKGDAPDPIAIELAIPLLLDPEPIQIEFASIALTEAPIAIVFAAVELHEVPIPIELLPILQLALYPIAIQLLLPDAVEPAPIAIPPLLAIVFRPIAMQLGPADALTPMATASVPVVIAFVLE